MGAVRVWRWTGWTLAAVVLQSTVVGCSGPGPEPASPTVVTSAEPVAADRTDLPVAVLPGGGRIELELAVTPEEVSQGLMFRPALAANRGMLFVFDQPRRPSFWMKNTLIPLDLVFLGDDGTVVDVIADAQPCAADPCPQYVPSAPARAVLEVNGGTAARTGMVTGARLRFERVPGYPTRY